MTYYPFRAQGDETWMVKDINTILANGQIVTTDYHAGIATQVNFSIILNLTGIPYSPGSQWISPTIGGVLYAIIILVIYSIWRHTTRSPVWWGFVMPIPAMYIFAGQFNRFFLTSHKQFMIFSTILMILMINRIISSSQIEPRFFIILLLFILSVSFMNNAWGLVYGIVVGVPLFVQWIHTRTTSYLSLQRGIGIIGISLIINHTLQRFESVFSSVETSLVVFVSSLTAEGGPSKQGSETVGGVTSNWPVFQVFDYNIPTVYIWTSGIIIIAALSALTTLYILYLLMTSSCMNAFGYVAIGTNIGFFALVSIVLLQSDIDTARRIAPIPGLMTILYLSTILSEIDNKNTINKNIILKSLFVILLLSSVLTVPRMMADGKISPYDIYINEKEETAVEFIGERALVDGTSIQYPNTPSKNAAIKKSSINNVDRVWKIPVASTDKVPTNSIIYSSGVKTKYMIIYTNAVNSSS
jgi:hypothetical protein